MAGQKKLARCRTCDLLIPVGYQLGLHWSLYCDEPRHWQRSGYDPADITAGMERRARLMQHLRETLGFARHDLHEVASFLDDGSPPAAPSPRTESAGPELDAQIRHLLRWLDDTPS